MHRHNKRRGNAEKIQRQNPGEAETRSSQDARPRAEKEEKLKKAMPLE